MNQMVTIENPGEIRLHCPFCGKKVFAEKSMQTPCKHTLYVAFEVTMHYVNEDLALRIGVYEEIEDIKDAILESTRSMKRMNIINFELYRVSHHLFYAFVGFKIPNVVEPKKSSPRNKIAVR